MLRQLSGTARVAPCWRDMRLCNDKQSIPRYLIANGIIGCAAGLLWGLLMLLTNTAGLATLVSASADPAVEYALVLAGSAAAMIPVALAAAIGLLAE